MVLSVDDASSIDDRWLIYGVGAAPSNPRDTLTYQLWMTDAHLSYLQGRLLQSNDLVEGSFEAGLSKGVESHMER